MMCHTGRRDDLSTRPHSSLDMPSNYDHITNANQRAFLNAYARCMNVTAAAKAASIARETHYDWMADETYREAFQAARLRAGDALEAEAVKRARGIREPVLYQGDLVMIDGKPLYRRRASDALLTLLLKGAKPDVYRERIEHSGPGGGPLTHKVDLSGLTDEELDLAERLAEKARARSGGDPERAD